MSPAGKQKATSRVARPRHEPGEGFCVGRALNSHKRAESPRLSAGLPYSVMLRQPSRVSVPVGRFGVLVKGRWEEILAVGFGVGVGPRSFRVRLSKRHGCHGLFRCNPLPGINRVRDVHHKDGAFGVCVKPVPDDVAPPARRHRSIVQPRAAPTRILGNAGLVDVRVLGVSDILCARQGIAILVFLDEHRQPTEPELPVPCTPGASLSIDVHVGADHPNEWTSGTVFCSFRRLSLSQLCHAPRGPAAAFPVHGLHAVWRFETCRFDAHGRTWSQSFPVDGLPVAELRSRMPWRAWPGLRHVPPVPTFAAYSRLSTIQLGQYLSLIHI